MYTIGYRITSLSCLLPASTMLLHVRTYIRISALSPCYSTEHVILPMTGPDHVSKAFWCVTLSVPGGGGFKERLSHPISLCYCIPQQVEIHSYVYLVHMLHPPTYKKIVGNRCTVNPTLVLYCLIAPQSTWSRFMCSQSFHTQSSYAL